MTLSYVVWRQNGDHPDDGAARQDRSREGLVVRRYRHPGVLGAQTCPHCGVRMHEHGWIDCGEDGAVVCPGNIVITHAGQHYAMTARTFELFEPKKGFVENRAFREALPMLAPAVERILGLPSGSVKRWGTGEETREERVLRQLIERYPWVLNVAEANYDPAVARAEVVRAAADVVAWQQNKLQNGDEHAAGTTTGPRPRAGRQDGPAGEVDPKP
jgi:hypothetical protein